MSFDDDLPVRKIPDRFLNLGQKSETLRQNGRFPAGKVYPVKSDNDILSLFYHAGFVFSEELLQIYKILIL